MVMNKQRIGIFRHQLFKISEVFIVNQASSLTKFDPIYIGRSSEITNTSIISENYEINDLSYWGRFPLKHFHVLTRNPSPYLKILKDVNLSLLHAHFGIEGVYAYPLAKKKKIPLVTTFHGFDATTHKKDLLLSGSIGRINYVLFQKKLAKNGDLFICVSDYIKNKIIELGFPEEKTVVHHIGIDVNRLLLCKQESDKKYILHVARLVDKKGTEFLIKAFAILAKKNKDIQLVIVGDGPLLRKLKAISEFLGVENRVIFTGFLSNNKVIELMNQSLFLVVPSITAASGDSEGLPVVILEAASMGLPVIGTDHSGIPDALIDDKTGYLVAEKDINALFEKMEFLVRNSQIREKMSINAVSFMKNNYDIVKQTSKLEKLYEGLL